MNKILKCFALTTLGFLIVACGNTNNEETPNSEPENSVVDSSIDDRPFVNDELSTESGLVVKFNAKGARIETIKWDGTQIAKDGFIAGRCANRVANATFELNGQTYNLDKNNGQHHLHGGSKGFGEINWTKVSQTASSIVYSIHSQDGDMGYPGTMDMTVTYTLSEEGELGIEYFATTDKDTLCNPINHLYMSLNGNNNAKNHRLWLDADKYTAKDSGLIPTGKLIDVAGTKYDFTTEKAVPVNSGWNADNFDDNFVLNGEGYRKVASMTGTVSNISVDVYTDRPGLQLYVTSSDICLEAQNFPDAIHHDNFPSPVLRANEEFRSKTTYVFTR